MARVARSLLTIALVGLGCSPPTPTDAREGQASEPERVEPASASTAPEFVPAPAQGDVIELVAAEHARAVADRRTLIVYVGAKWCEPCRYFHAAVEDGSLDDSLGGVRLLEFDLDRDRDRLLAANYRSRMIPLFVVPDPDGRPSSHRREGGIKGPAAVERLRKELVSLLAEARSDPS